jgi:hypothetical protein
MGNNFFAQKLSTLSFMKVNPIYTGGDSIRSYQQDSLLITINKPVFESLIGTSRKGFVQVRFSGELPGLINSTIDYNNDSKPDFSLNINTLTGDTKLEPISENVIALDVSSKVKDYWITRVRILNPDKK